MKKTKLKLKKEHLRALTGTELVAVAGGIPTANVSAENVSCCSFDAACPSDGCTILSRGTRCADCF